MSKNGISRLSISKKAIAAIILFLIVPSAAIGGYYLYHTARYNPPVFDGSSIDLSDEIDIVHETESFEGLNLFVVGKFRDGTDLVDDFLGKTRKLSENYMLITDMEGNILFNEYVGRGAHPSNFPAEFIDPYTILVGTSSGAALFDIRTRDVRYLGVEGHHEYEYNHNNDTFFTIHHKPQTVDGHDYLFDEIVEYDLSGNEVWSVEMSNFVDPDWWCPSRDRSRGLPDITHTNTVFYDHETDDLYINPRNLNTFYKIDHATGEVEWGLGEYGNFTLYDIHGNEQSTLFYHSHALEKIGEDTFIIFDNDLHNTSPSENRKSRLQEITIDTEKMIANETWVYAAPASYYSSSWGDADRLPNGNRIGVFGERGNSEDVSCSITEVNEEGEIVWELSLPRYDEEYIDYGIYRVERYRENPIISSPQNVLTSKSNPPNLSWNAWYNFRTKRTLRGNYTIYKDGNREYSADFSFPMYSRPANISYQPESLAYGNHNFTIEITNDVGQSVSDAMTVSVVPFHVSRHGPTEIEVGSPNDTLYWKGFTDTSYSSEIFVNESLYDETQWNGQNLFLNLTQLGIGTHEIEMNLINSTEIVYSDAFNVSILPSQAPEILNSPGNVSVYYGDEWSLEWEVQDQTPDTWRIFVNSTVMLSSDWENQSLCISWAQNLDVGIYNVTLVLEDAIGFSTTETIWLEVLQAEQPIINYTSSSKIEWGENITLSWGVLRGAEYIVYANDTVVAQGNVTEGQVSVNVNWRNRVWMPGNVNLTIFVEDEIGVQSTLTKWIEIVTEFSDPYADEVVTTRSSWYEHGANALGAPDGEVANIFADYGNGYLTLDMGKGEEILDEPGDDFRIIAQGEYVVSVSTSLTERFETYEVASGNQDFDLETISLSSARYVRVEYYTGSDVKLDAVEAYSYDRPVDTSPPLLQSIEDVVAWNNQSVVTLEWDAIDYTPKEYTIFVNGSVQKTESWNGSLIKYDFTTDKIGTWNITIVVTDSYGNSARDVVMVTVKGISPDFKLYPIALIPIGIIAGIIVFIFYRQSVLSHSTRRN